MTSWKIGGLCCKWAALLLLVMGCSSDDQEGGKNEGTAGVPSIDWGDGGNDGSGNDLGLQDLACTGMEVGEGCAARAYEDESVPLDIYVMFDQSGSMCSCVDPPILDGPCPDPSCKKTRIEAIREAMDAFMDDSQSRGIGLGIAYFGQQTIGQADCSPATYSVPSVDIDTLPDNASRVSASLHFVEPTGETPTGAAIRGACTHAQRHKADHPKHQVVILLLTDGEPKAPVTCGDQGGSCCPTLDDAVAATSDCASGDRPIKTYVLGVGPFLSNLAEIAEAGLTDHAYLVEEGDVTEQVLGALNDIRGAAQVPCELNIPAPPSGQVLNYDEVNIIAGDESCEGRTIPAVGSQAACGDGTGWYYDDANQPSQVLLCPRTCDEVGVPGTSLMFSMGCGTIVIPE